MILNPIVRELPLLIQKDGFDVEILLPKEKKGVDPTDLPVKFVLPHLVMSLKSRHFFKYIFFRYKTDADMVHTINDYPYSVIARRIALQNKIPYIVTAHGTYAVKPLLKQPDRFFLKKVFEDAAKVLPVSEFTKAQILKYL